MGKVSTWSRPEVKYEKEEKQKAERLQEEIEVAVKNQKETVKTWKKTKEEDL